MSDSLEPEQWIRVKQLETGSSSSVLLVFHKHTVETAVIKMSRGDFDSDILLNNRFLKKEFQLLSQLHHPAIVRVRSLFQTEQRSIVLREIGEIAPQEFIYPIPRLALVMDWYPGRCLHTYMAVKKRLNQQETIDLLKPIVSALIYLKTQGVIHRDIKLENIFLDAQNNAYLGDFGLALGPGENDDQCCGTVIAMAPEIINAKQYSPASDLWALGVCIYGCLVGSRPFGEGNDESDVPTICQKIRSLDYRMPSRILGEAGVDVLRKIFVLDPAARISAEDLLEHNFFNSPVLETLAVEPLLKKQKPHPLDELISI